jgi:uncharacterized protein (TIGR03083 family)
MDVSAHIDTLRVEGARLAAAAALSGPPAPVPTCPEWAVRDLVYHQGGVHRWATAYVEGGHTEPGAVDFSSARGPLPADPDLVDWFLSGHAALVEALAGASPDLQCWTFLRAPSPLAFWARRQAHEITIHRVDTELAAGTTLSAITSDVAADGIDELLVGFGPARGRRKEDTEREPAVIAVRCTDHEAGWIVRLGPEGVIAERAPGTSEIPARDAKSRPISTCAVHGTAADLYLALWRRRATETLTLEGNGDALNRLLENART